jgi:hypothetical protein
MEEKVKKIDNRLLSTTILILLLTFFPCISLAQHVNPKCCNYPAKPDAVKIQFFLEACAVPGETARGMIPYFDCQSYVLGIIDGYRLLKSSSPKDSQICLPESITTREVLELIWKTYPNWEIAENRQAGEVILEVLRKEFRCGRK